MQSAPRLDALDGLRTIAVGAVIVAHLEIAPFYGGQLGVHIFFALSGFLITTLLLAEWQRNGRIDLGAFYWRRFLRLGPALAFVVLVGTALALAWGYKHWWSDALASTLYVQNITQAIWGQHPNLLGHTWSLAAEEQFYLLWPAALVLLLRRDAPILWVVAGVIVVATALTAAFHLAWSVGTVYVLPSTSVAPLMIGVGAAVLQSRGLRPQSRALVAHPVTPLIAGLVLAVLITRPIFSWSWSYRGGFQLTALATVAVIAHTILAPAGWAARALSVRPMVWIGQRSYGLYLWQSPAIKFAEHEVPGLKTPVALALAFAMTEISWRLVELPANRYKARYVRAGDVDLTRVGAVGVGDQLEPDSLASSAPR